MTDADNALGMLYFLALLDVWIRKSSFGYVSMTL